LDLALIARTTECIFHVSRESEGRLLALRDAIGSEDEEALVASQEKCVNLQLLLAQRTRRGFMHTTLTATRHDTRIGSIESTTRPSGCIRT
jgi:hypothetical protein